MKHATQLAATDTRQSENATQALDWTRIEAGLNAHGFAIVPRLLDVDACRSLRGRYQDDALYRSTVVMARYGFGRGEYRYYAYPLSDPIVRLRSELYPPLAGIANRWAERLGEERRFPVKHDAFLAACHEAGQSRPTPLLLRYGPGDYNCLHQDLYGERVFPLQVAVLLSAPGEEFEGGEFVLTEQRPRRQSRAMVAPLAQGDAVIFAVDQRPVEGGRGVYRTTMRHGVSEIRSGERFTLGVIFHDAT